MADVQLLKGILEGCVLSLISRGETYGYEILAALDAHGFADIYEGTLYPILTRLERNGYIRCRKEKSPFGPIRKYFSITPSGEDYLSAFCASYRQITAGATSILEEGKTP